MKIFKKFLLTNNISTSLRSRFGYMHFVGNEIPLKRKKSLLSFSSLRTRFFPKGDKYVFFIFALVFIFFYKFFLSGLIPIPADTIAGMYHPFKDLVYENYPAGVPFKNYLITDPVRQQYVWRKIAIEEIKNKSLPLWNPYSFSGYPLLANMQSAVYYPLNILFFILPFNIAWGLLVVLELLLSCLFMYFYLRNLTIKKEAAFFASIAFSFSGFFVSWLLWNTVLHVALWLPLTLLAVDKILIHFKNSKKQDPKTLSWATVFLLSLLFSFFAGHLQIFFYSFVFTVVYIFIKLLRLKQKRLKPTLLFVVSFLLFAIISSVQLIPTLKFISLSARSYDQGLSMSEGWFIPLKHLIQFFAPDYFGSPATLNYYGVWNYAEFVGFIGIPGLFFSIFALIWLRSKKILFFGSMFFLSLIFATPNIIAKLPFLLKIPLISTSQPTRLIFIIVFSLCVLTGFGFDYFIKAKRINKKIAVVLSIFILIYLALWIYVIFISKILSVQKEYIIVSKRNLIFPSLIFLLFFILAFLNLFFKDKKIKNLLKYGFIMLLIFDLFRFGWKFTPFSPEGLIFPKTEITKKLEEDKSLWRFIATDRRIMPPNFSNYYHFQSVSGYDPIYLETYGKLVSSWNKGGVDLTSATFGRIITPQNINSIFTDLLGVKYIMTFDELKNEQYQLVLKEGETYLYQNKNYFPRAYLVEQLIRVDSPKKELETIFSLGPSIKTKAVTSENISLTTAKLQSFEKIDIKLYNPNKIIIDLEVGSERLMVLSDIYYPDWQVYIDGEKGKIIKVNYAFRGVIITKGKHRIEFRIKSLI